eukprot:4672367-Amphidinium_carterae.1
MVVPQFRAGFDVMQCSLFSSFRTVALPALVCAAYSTKNASAYHKHKHGNMHHQTNVHLIVSHRASKRR